MKKFFLFAAAIAATLTATAQTYDFSTLEITDATINVTNGTKTYNESKAYYEIKNTAGETVVMTLSNVPNVEFSYKNSAEKTAFKVSPGKNIQMDGNQRDITFNNVTPGTQITISVASKGATGAQFVDSDKGTAFTGAIAASTQAGVGTALPAKDGDYVYTDIVMTATASTVIVRETAAGYVLSKIVIGAGSGINETMAQNGVYYNGSEIVNANGKNISVYNVLGKMVASNCGNINMSSFANGVYVVRVEGVKGAMKIQK